jgi:hypothetical protein
LAHVLLNCPFGNPDAQLEQLPADAFSAPQTIVAGHGLDQGHRLGTDFGFPESGLRSMPPELAECLTMPAEEGLGLHNQERLCPVTGSPRKQQQEEPIGLATRWALHLTEEDDELMAKQRIFRDEVGLGASEVGERPSQCRVTGWLRPLS